MYWSKKVFRNLSENPSEVWLSSPWTLSLEFSNIFRLVIHWAGIYLLKINNRNIRARCWICSKLSPRSGVSIVNFEQVIAGWASPTLWVGHTLHIRTHSSHNNFIMIHWYRLWKSVTWISLQNLHQDVIDTVSTRLYDFD